jgi:1-phosphofructokinase family hexose kinase
MGEFDLLAIGVNPAMDRYYRAGRISLGAVNRIELARSAPGGKANNFARAYQRLGGCPITTGIVGGVTGHAIIDALDEEGIAYDYVSSPAESRSTATLVSDESTTVLLEAGPAVPDVAFEALTKKVGELARDVQTVVICGSLPPTASPGYLATLVDVIKAESTARIAVDTSGEPLRLVAQSGVDIVKVNAAELEDAFGIGRLDKGQVERLFAQLHGNGVSMLCITAGAKGALIYTRDDAFTVNARVDHVVSTVGAGDAFLAGLLIGLKRSSSLRDAAALAAASAAAATQTIGAGFVDPALAFQRTGTARMASAAEFFAGEPE